MPPADYVWIGLTRYGAAHRTSSEHNSSGLVEASAYRPEEEREMGR